MDQKKLIITSIVIYLIAAIGAYLGTTSIASSSTKKVASNQTIEPTIPSEPLTEECPINGAMYGKTAKEKWVKRRPLAIVVENSPDSRPQSGLSSAQVVYEGVSEGGVTRFLGIYYCEGAKTVGPVRSARVHFINLLREWGNNPLYAHVGGANCNRETGSGCGNGAPADALGLISKLGWRMYNDLDQFRVSYPSYWRDPDRLPGVAADHTMYTDTDKLWKYASTETDAQPSALAEVDEEGVRWDENWKPWSFVDDASSNARGNVSHISYHFYDSGESTYGVTWKYDNSKNEYSRYHGNKPHMDLNTDAQLTAKNILVILANEYGANDDYPGGHVVYDLTGSGELYAYQNGKEIKGTWEKDELDSKMRFLDEKNQEIPIVRGRVWISLIPEGNEVYAGTSPKASNTKENQQKTKTQEPSLDE